MSAVTFVQPFEEMSATVGPKYSYNGEGIAVLLVPLGGPGQPFGALVDR